MLCMGTCGPGNGQALLSCSDCTGTGPWSLHLLDTWTECQNILSTADFAFGTLKFCTKLLNWNCQSSPQLSLLTDGNQILHPPAPVSHYPCFALHQTVQYPRICHVTRYGSRYARNLVVGVPLSRISFKPNRWNLFMRSFELCEEKHCSTMYMYVYVRY
jgi:hypothetical protein